MKLRNPADPPIGKAIVLIAIFVVIGLFVEQYFKQSAKLEQEAK